jgi:diguanylate cyclase (GGDEF)-like protein
MGPGSSAGQLMVWSRRLMAVFWVVFVWNLIFLVYLSGEHADRGNTDLEPFILPGIALFNGIIALTLRRLARLIDGEVRRIAGTDTLTGLANRAVFVQRVNDALTSPLNARHKAAVFFVDVDRFKTINDNLGHVVGDQVLQQVARRLARLVGPTDTLSRFGGDEFTVLRPGLNDIAQATSLAQVMIDAFQSPIHLEGRDIFSSISVGIAMSNAGSQVDDLIRDADIALYRAKAAGRGISVLYDPRMVESEADQLRLEADLWLASKRDQLSLYYQPQFSLQSGEVAGFEALIRWNHPLRGLLLPGSFIGIAEQNGSLRDIGFWALDEACNQIRTWDFTLSGHRPIEMSVNLSAMQLTQKNFLDRLGRILEKYDVEPGSLCLELTETVLLENNPIVIGTLIALKKELGIRLAIDDFGTGYASLSYLKNLPIDAVKIDRSFVGGMESDESSLFIVQSIVTLAHDLGLSVTAEGIETDGQLALLQRLGCDAGQGFYLSRPLASESFDGFDKISLLHDWPPVSTNPHTAGAAA